jgi:hypothetical protein
MRACLLLLLFSGIPAVAQSETNIACVERLEIPAYPILAMQARIAGALTATVLLGSDASVGKISAEWSSTFKKGDMFQSAVEKSLRSSTFASACAGKELKLVFNFVMAESLPPPETRFSFGYPNKFWITAPHPLVQP